MARYAAQEDGSIAYADADDITVVEPITKPVQTAGGYTRHEPDHELAALMAAAPDLLAALEDLLDQYQPGSPDLYLPSQAKKWQQAREAIARATNPDYVQNSIGQTRDRIIDPLLELIEEAEADLQPGDRVICDGREYTLKEKNPDNTAEWLAKRPQAMGFYVLHNCSCRLIERPQKTTAEIRAAEHRVLEAAAAEAEAELWP